MMLLRDLQCYMELYVSLLLNGVCKYSPFVYSSSSLSCSVTTLKYVSCCRRARNPLRYMPH